MTENPTAEIEVMRLIAHLREHANPMNSSEDGGEKERGGMQL